MKLLSQEELERAVAQWEEFARLVSHDLKAPVRAIDNLAQWIQEDLGQAASPEVAENLGLLRSRAHRLTGLVDDLLEYSRAGTGNREAEDIDLEALFKELLSAKPARPGLKVAVGSGLPALRAPREALKRALDCLLSNASKHHDKKEGRIGLSAREAGTQLEIAVEDDGPGIEPRHHERIFQVFQTLKPRDEVEGSGMGLALARRLVESMGGSLGLESAPGQGSKFFVRLPRP